MIARAFPRASGKWSTRSGLQSFIDPDTKFVTIREPAFNCLVSVGWNSPFWVSHADDCGIDITRTVASDTSIVGCWTNRTRFDTAAFSAFTFASAIRFG